MPQIEPATYAIELGEKENPFSVSELIEYGLLCSGTPENDVTRYRETVEKHIRALGSYLEKQDSEQPLGEIVLDFMHAHITTNYREEQTRLDILLDYGSYNCVSSSVLYTILARSVGLHVGSVYTSDHVFCVVTDGSATVDVETTNKYGYNPGEKKEFHDKFGRTGYTYVPPGKYRLRTDGNDAVLLAFMLQNRISGLERKRRYETAVPLAVDRYYILKTEKAYDAMIKEFTNYAAYLNDRLYYQEALDFIGTVKTVYGDEPALIRISEVLINNTLATHLKNNHFEKALSFIEKTAENSSVSSSMLENWISRIEEKRTVEMMRTLPPDEAISYLDSRYRENQIPKERYEEYIVQLHLKKAQLIAEEVGWLEGFRYIETVRKEFPGNRQLNRVLGVFGHNYAAEAHNRFARLFNSREYEQAEELVLKALEQMPDSTLLTRDLTLVRKALAQ